MKTPSIPTHCSKAEVGAEPDGFDLTGIELTIRRISLKILDQQLQLPVTNLPVLELDTTAYGDIGTPVILFLILQIRG